jgi:C4-dicarboxylate transporter DctQ subunit
MSAGTKYVPKGRLARYVHSFEENAIALTLGVMTLLTFTNVVRRYIFNASLIWSLEVVLVLFAWLVLFGIAYGFKMTSHLGVDALTNMLPRRGRRVAGIISAVLCVFFGILLLKGAWDYWAPFAELPRTTGRWLPTGIEWNTRGTAYFETDQIPMPGFLKFLEDWINYGDSYSKLPRVVPYVILPIASALILVRIVQATIRIWRGEQDSLIVSHEAEDAVEEVAALNREA